MQTIEGRIVDIPRKEIFIGQVVVNEQGQIQAIYRQSGAATNKSSLPFILPGLVDAHVHIESSMLLPTEFARLAAAHGTIATVSDPHEIANVLGMAGVEYMLDNAANTPLSINFGAPSCVPATSFETAGATLGVEEVSQLLARPEIRYLSEVMNYPGVLHKDPDVMAKIEAAKKLGKVIDGHAPGLRGEDAKQYAAAGISTDHECFTAEEAQDKLAAGMKILIREGSAARNYAALHSLIPDHASQMMFCTDDSHPDDLIEGHINKLLARAIADGHDLWQLLQMACCNPVAHYGLPVGQLQVGDPADFILLDNLHTFDVLATYRRGQKIAEKGKILLSPISAPLLNNFHCQTKRLTDFNIPVQGRQIRLITVQDGELVTGSAYAEALIVDGYAQADPNRDILKIAVVNRYQNAPVALGFVQGVQLGEGALASSVAHDSHNIVVVGTNDDSICRAVNALIATQGGIAAVKGHREEVLPLPLAGIMTNAEGSLVAQQYSQITHFAQQEMACSLRSPFMTLSFLALLVIPALKMSDRGLFDGDKFAFASLWR